MVSRPTVFKGQARGTEARNRAADERRGTAAERGYGPKWAAASKGYRLKHPLCVGCHAVNTVKAAELVDHVIPHKGEWPIFWDRDNWQSCCKWHHDSVKQKLERQWALGRLPASALRLDSEAAKRLTRHLRGY